MIYGIIKQGDSDSEVIICFGAKFKLSVDLIQLGLLKVIVVSGFTLRQWPTSNRPKVPTKVLT